MGTCNLLMRQVRRAFYLFPSNFVLHHLLSSLSGTSQFYTLALKSSVHAQDMGYQSPGTGRV